MIPTTPELQQEFGQNKTFILTLTEESANLLGYKSGLVVNGVRILKILRGYYVESIKDGIFIECFNCGKWVQKKAEKQKKIVELECQLL